MGIQMILKRGYENIKNIIKYQLVSVNRLKGIHKSAKI